MIEIILGILAWVIAIAWVVFGFYRLDEGAGAYSVKKVVVYNILPAILLVLFASSFYVIQPGHAAAVKRFGLVQPGYAAPGPHFKIPFVDELVDYRTMQLNYETSDVPNSSQAVYPDVTIETMTEDGQKIQMRYTILFHIDATKIGYIIQNIGNESDLVERVVKSISRSEARNIPKSFKAADLYGSNIYLCEKAILTKLGPMFEKNGVIIDQFLLREVTFDAELTKALEDKQIALERQTTSARLVEVAKNEANAIIEKTKGESESARLMQNQLIRSPEYNQYVLFKGIADGKVPNLQYIGVTPTVTSR
jgi:prohibitin 1